MFVSFGMKSNQERLETAKEWRGMVSNDPTGRKTRVTFEI